MSKLELIPVNPSHMGFLRKTRNEYREWFFDSREVTRKIQLAWFRKYVASWWDVMFVIHFDSVPMGTIAIYNIDIGKREAEIGRLIICKEYHRRGCAIAAIKLILEYGRNILEMDNFHVWFKPENLAALNLYRKAGFTVIEEKGKMHGRL